MSRSSTAGGKALSGNTPDLDLGSSRPHPHDPEQIRRQSFESLGITTPDRAMWNLRNVLREIGEDQEQRIFDALKSASDADASLGGLERLLCGSLGFPEAVLDPGRLERLI